MLLFVVSQNHIMLYQSYTNQGYILSIPIFRVMPKFTSLCTTL